MHLSKWAPVPQYTAACGWGFGLAACPSLGLLVTSNIDNNTLSVWSLPGLDAKDSAGVGKCSGSGLVRHCILGGKGSPASMQFDFMSGGGYSGYLAFTLPPPDADAPHLLLVTDHGHDAVHMIDVVNRAHAGYLAAPGSIAGPRGVAVSKVAPLVAVSAWKKWDDCDHVVHIYRAGSGGGSHWTHVQVIGDGFGVPGASDGQLDKPFGLRFSVDGTAICVADAMNDRVSMFRVDDGGFERHIATGLNTPIDVEEVECGWMVACEDSHTVEFVCGDGDGGWPFLGKAGGGLGSVDGELYGPAALALVPGLGLIVRDCWNSRLQVFSTPDMLAMRAMSAIRVGWMTSTYRAAVNRLFLLGAKRTRDLLCAAAIAP